MCNTAPVDERTICSDLSDANFSDQCFKLEINVGSQSVLPVHIVKDLTPRQYVEHVASNMLENEDPFYVVNLSQLINRYDKWMAKLPQVHPFYAVKCNDDPAILRTLAALGCGFDCASQNEIMAILQLGVPPDKIIYAQPCKQISHLRYAASSGVSMMTFDNEAEIFKIKEHFQSARLVLRIATDDSNSVFQYSNKFGCSVEGGKQLLQLCKRLHMNVIGLSFHVGSLCNSSSSYQNALARCAELFEYAATIGYSFTLLDIGGGFPGQKGTDALFDELSAGIAEALSLYFSSLRYPNLNIISEPGYFFGCSTCLLTVSVIAKRCFDEGGTKRLEYYLNDGTYGSFYSVRADNFLQSLPIPMLHSETAAQETYSTTLWGPTCDSLDKICDTHLPELEIGDRLCFEDMGGYTTTCASNFNGFSFPRRIYYIMECDREKLQKHVAWQESGY